MARDGPGGAGFERGGAGLSSVAGDLGDDLGPQRVRMEDLTGTAGAGGEQEDALASEAKRLPPPGGLGLGLGLGRTDVDTVTGEGLALGVGEVEGAGEAGALAGEVPPDHEVGGVQEGTGVAEELQACLGGGAGAARVFGGGGDHALDPGLRGVVFVGAVEQAEAATTLIGDGCGGGVERVAGVGATASPAGEGGGAGAKVGEGPRVTRGGATWREQDGGALALLVGGVGVPAREGLGPALAADGGCAPQGSGEGEAELGGQGVRVQQEELEDSGGVGDGGDEGEGEGEQGEGVGGPGGVCARQGVTAQRLVEGRVGADDRDRWGIVALEEGPQPGGEIVGAFAGTGGSDQLEAGVAGRGEGLALGLGEVAGLLDRWWVPGGEDDATGLERLEDPTDRAGEGGGRVDEGDRGEREVCGVLEGVGDGLPALAFAGGEVAGDLPERVPAGGDRLARPAFEGKGSVVVQESLRGAPGVGVEGTRVVAGGGVELREEGRELLGSR